MDVSAGISSAGAAVAKTAGQYVEDSHKSALEEVRLKLANELAIERDMQRQGWEGGQKDLDRALTASEGAATRASHTEDAKYTADQHLKGAQAHAGATMYSADQSRAAHKYATDNPAEVKMAEWFTKATPEQRDGYLETIMAKHGFPSWAIGKGKGASDGTDPASVAGGGSPDAKATKAGFNDSALNGVPEDVQAIVKGMVEGRIQHPGSFALTKPYWQAMMQVATKYDPNFDATSWNARVAVRKDFTSGKSAQAITAMNTALGHAGSLMDDFKKLDNGDVPAWNWLVNIYGKEVQGKDAMTVAKMGVDSLASEARKVFAASGVGNLTELQEWQKNFPLNGSAEQQAGALRKFADLLNSRLLALSERYNNGMQSTREPLAFLDPKPREVFIKISGAEPGAAVGYQTGTKPPTTTKAATPPASAPPPTRQGAPLPASDKEVEPGVPYWINGKNWELDPKTGRLIPWTGER